MSINWFQLDTNLPTKPEVRRLVRLTGLPVDTIIGRLVMWWAQVDQHAGPVAEADRPAGRPDLDGSVPDYEITDCVAVCGGDAEFWAAVAETGWIHFEDGQTYLPGFDDRFSLSAKQRHNAARRQQRKRAREDGTIATSAKKPKKTARAEQKKPSAPSDAVKPQCQPAHAVATSVTESDCVTNVTAGVTSVTPQRDQRRGEERTPQERRRQEKTPPPPGDAVAVADDAVQWVTAAAAIRQCGVNLASDTMKKARHNGLTPVQVTQIVDYYRNAPAGRFAGPGALRNRLITADVAGLPVDQGWPGSTATPDAGTVRYGEVARVVEVHCSECNTVACLTPGRPVVCCNVCGNTVREEHEAETLTA